ncbi:HD-GYP domain-containing protein [Thalassomonas haliotis]|uniref:HD-GYP domain-containing protein n=1 Tax=Thalassomonas haliotis TaxID=485448 RepID=A0ABY7VC56_9GAMM|nr:HD-GYP domain-containing protein [Thalassomonas haliotis]WDE10972.1 HD-GYP domain-containing protein [Thalassomonas haliotis]
MITIKKITELSVGHYVVAIAEQTGHFTLTHPGYIKSKLVIRNLNKKGVLSVKVDISKSLDIKKTIQSVEAVTEYPVAPFPQAPVIRDLNKARKLFNESKEIQQQVIADVQNGRQLDLRPVADITGQTMEAIIKDPDALACVINIREKDAYLLEHSISVSVLITIFARHLGFKKKIIHQLAIGAFLHDVGKIKIPDNILNKPSKLSYDEFEQMKSHVNHSIKIVKNLPGISNAALSVVALHHEKLTGQGYPQQLSAEKISRYGRMITICDIFDALTADRVYKEGYCHVKAFSILRKLAQKKELDHQLVDQFIKCMGIYPVGTLVELNSHRLAIVDGRNLEDPIRPKVRSFYNVEHHHYMMTEDIDLAVNEDFIIKGVRADDFNLDMNKIVEFLLMEG